MASNQDHAASGSASGNGALPKVLLVEDDAMVRSYVSTVLEVGGFEVIEACDGQEAVDLFAELASTIAVVVMDMTLPRLAGAKVLPRLREIRKDIPILMTSGFSDMQGMMVDDVRTLFLPKPFTPDQLLQTLDRFHS